MRTIEHDAGQGKGPRLPQDSSEDTTPSSESSRVFIRVITHFSTETFGIDLGQTRSPGSGPRGRGAIERRLRSHPHWSQRAPLLRLPEQVRDLCSAPPPVKRTPPPQRWAAGRWHMLSHRRGRPGSRARGPCQVLWLSALTGAPGAFFWIEWERREKREI